MTRRRTLGAVALMAALLAAGPSRAVEPDEVLPDAGLEARARDVSSGLRCLVCQNQSIDDSAAPLARDLRLIVREHLKAGDTDAEIRAYLVQRYGDFVLLKPPFERATLLLWATPALVVVFGGMALWRRRRPGTGAAPLDPDEQARVDALMAEPPTRR
ncbi:cytochrome c-type biogenesis protein CcmH [Lichenibacterium minor]|uniref:Cytochrome c-type biogenesis protein n=1 Tax=Lichenibacterium minor TaxID=2316528 RepID=A0A4Q2U8T9_9HYPH|nr:cytochrome c-type biogenesis protein [Lichenibacterium minor]RYC31507.1 cytochrome c-type biogenesis protein CcmH [Lichenibacterium minor]